MSTAVNLLDEKALENYLRANLPGFSGALKASKFPGGQSNPTFLLEADSEKYVLRRKPPGILLKSAHAVDREYRVTKALLQTDVPVAKPLLLCEDDSVIGSIFYVMEYLDGRIFWNPALPELDNAGRTAVYQQMCSVLAALHRVDTGAVGLGDYGKPGSYFERQVGRWSQQYRASETETIEAMDTLIDWLPKNLPADDGRVSLAHGDYRLDNLIFHKTEPRIIAVVDWELSTLGHPFADIAYQCMQLRLPSENTMGGLAGLDRRLLGIPTEEEYVAMYCRHSSIDGIPHWNFYLVFSFFRLAAILQGVKKRALDGNASSAKALQMGELAKPLARMAVELI